MLDRSAELKLQLLVTRCDQDNIISSHRHDLLPFLLLDGQSSRTGGVAGREEDCIAACGLADPTHRVFGRPP